MPRGAGLHRCPRASYAAYMFPILLCLIWALAGPEISAPSTAYAVGSARNLDGAELIKIGDLHEVQNHYQEALPYYDRAVSVYRKQRNRSGEATALARIGRVLKRQERYEEALKALQRAEVLWAPAAQRAERARTLLDLGEVSEKLGRLDDARHAYTESRILFEQAKVSDGVLEGMVRLGALLAVEGKTAEAVTLLEQTVRDAQRRRDTTWQLTALLALGDAKAKEDISGSIAIYEEALRLAVAQRDREREASSRSKLAGVLESTGRHEAALDMASKALILYQSLRDRSHEAETLLLLGILNRSAGQLTTAIEYHERALGLYRALRDRRHEAATLMTLSTMYGEQGAQENAEETQKKALLLLSPSP
jgi:tetratricopeptide (TPR) repeat protein